GRRWRSWPRKDCRSSPYSRTPQTVYATGTSCAAAAASGSTPIGWYWCGATLSRLPNCWPQNGEPTCPQGGGYATDQGWLSIPNRANCWNAIRCWMAAVNGSIPIGRTPRTPPTLAVGEIQGIPNGVC